MKQKPTNANAADKNQKIEKASRRYTRQGVSLSPRMKGCVVCGIPKRRLPLRRWTRAAGPGYPGTPYEYNQAEIKHGVIGRKSLMEVRK